MDVWIFAGGDDLPPETAADLPDDAYVIAADSGLDLAARLGVTVDRLVGDLDSVSPEVLERFPDLAIDRYPVDKDATDLELAIRTARNLGADRIVVIGGHGGRLDHHLANAGLLGTQNGIDVEWRSGTETLHRVNERLSLHVPVGTTVSLLPVGGPASGIATTGLQWELSNDTLQPGSTRGVSNVAVAEQVTISVQSGNLVAIVLETT